MASIASFLGLNEIRKELSEISKKLDKINNQLGTITLTTEELTQALTEAGDKLDKAKAEILAEIEKIKAGGALTPEAQAAVERLKTIAQALDDIVPDVEPEA